MYLQVENYLMCSEYERQHMMDLISEDDSFNSSQVIPWPPATRDQGRFLSLLEQWYCRHKNIF